MNQTKLLLIDEMPAACVALNGWLRGHGLSVINAARLDDAIELLSDFTTGACVDVITVPVSLSSESINNVKDKVNLSCEGQQVEIVSFFRATGETRAQLEKIFSPLDPVSVSAPRRSVTRGV